MGRQIKTIYKKAESSFNNPEHQKKWQGGIGILVMVVFVLSSVLFNKTVQATIQSAGSYGYRGNGTYGYSASATADQIPANPTSISCSGADGGTTATCTVVHTGLTTKGTSAGTLTATVMVYDGAVSGSSCAGSNVGSNSSGTGTTSITSGLIAISPNAVKPKTYCAVTHVTDAVLNDSTGTVSNTFTIAAAAAGGSGPTAGSVGTPPPAPKTVVPNSDVVVNVPQTGTVDFLAAKAKVTSSVAELKVQLSAVALLGAASFVADGSTQATMKLGSGERLALVRDQLETLGAFSLKALEQLANGQKPTERNLKNEQKQASKLLAVFKKLAGHAPNFKNAQEDLAWNTLQYRTRFPRDLAKEKSGITKFRALFNRNPTSPFDWAAVRAAGYALGK